MFHFILSHFVYVEIVFCKIINIKTFIGILLYMLNCFFLVYISYFVYVQCYLTV